MTNALKQLALRVLPRGVVEKINSIPFGRRLARSAFWTLAGSICSRLLRIPVSIVLARWMGPAHYGELGISSNSIDLFSVFAGLGLGMTATKFIAELRSKDPQRAGKIIAVSSVVATVGGAIFATVLYLLAPWLATYTLTDPGLTAPLRIGAVALFFTALNGAQSGALYGFEAYRVTAQLQTALGLLDIMFMLGGYRLGGLNGVLWGMAASRFSNYLMLHFALKREARRHNIPLNLGHWSHELRVLWQFSIPAALAGIMVIPVNWVCSAILVNRPNGYSEMGAYNAANQWYNALIFLPAVLGSGLLPIFSDRMGNRDTRSTGRILKMMLQINGLIVIPAAIGMTIFSSLIMKLYGKGYSAAWPTLIAVVWTAAIMGIIAPVGDVIAASGRMWLGLTMNAGWAAVYISSTYLLVHWGSFGLASSRLIAYGVHTLWTLGFAYLIIRKHSETEQKLTPELQNVS
jgi:O-antigen/teichoic acid export membrane protein